MSLGEDRASPEELEDAISEFGGLDPLDFQLEVRRRCSFVTLEEPFAEDFIEALHGEELFGQPITVEYARKQS